MVESTAEYSDGLVYLYNIPVEYHARDLRSFFSQYIEASGFTCFHFRHRKEILFHSHPRESLDIGSSSFVSLIQKKNGRLKSSSNKLCCLISLPNTRVEEFILAYAGMHWFSTTDDRPLADQCFIRRVHIDDSNDFTAISKLIELKPPEWMPQGNVGTPTRHFFNLIKCCQLDSSIIKKLELNFSESKQRIYSAVPYDYGSRNSHVTTGLLSGEVRTQKGLRIVSEDEYLELQSLAGISGGVTPPSKYSPALAVYDNLAEDDCTDEVAEDWERFESLHDDPYKVERGDKANIKYEDKVELVWEKGGSGLVFHTDEYTWRKLDPLRKEEFFDEPASFDWDIDMEAYESPETFSIGPRPTGHWGMARDTSDLIDMSKKKDSIEHNASNRDLFTCTTKKTGDEYSLRLMRRMGWLPDASTQPYSSLTDILPMPCLKKTKLLPHKGLGYHGPRLIPSLSCDLPPVGARKSRPVYIRTAFDRPSVVKARTEATWQWPSLPDRQCLSKRDTPVDSPTVQPDQTVSHVRSRTVILSHGTMPLSREGITFVSGGLLPPVSFHITPPRQRCGTSGSSLDFTLN